MIKKLLGKISRKIVSKMDKNKKSPLKEEKKKFGYKNKKDTIYLIRRPSETVGLLSYVITTLGHIHVAVEKNWKIVVDMKNYPNMYSQNKKENAWEYFFEQPSGITLEEAYRSRNVILSSDKIPEFRPNDTNEFFCDYSTREYWKELCQKYININKNVTQYVEKISDELCLDVEGEKVVGVLCRGTDYTSLKPKNHPVQPSAEQMIEKIMELKNKHRVDKVFLVTEDVKILELFKSNFSTSELKYMKTNRFDSDNKEYLAVEMNKQKIDTKQQGIDYLVQIILLSRCNYFVAGRTSGSVGVTLFTEGFEYEYYWDLGRY